MKTAALKDIRQALAHCTAKELTALCVRLAVHKKENKELLTYLLFEAGDEHAFVQEIKQEINEGFDHINRRSFYTIKKDMRKLLRTVKKYIRYSKKKESEVELLLYFCLKMKEFSPSIHQSSVLKNMYYQQLKMVENRIPKLHEDLQFDFNEALSIVKN